MLKRRSGKSFESGGDVFRPEESGGADGISIDATWILPPTDENEISGSAPVRRPVRKTSSVSSARRRRGLRNR